MSILRYLYYSAEEKVLWIACRFCDWTIRHIKCSFYEERNKFV